MPLVPQQAICDYPSCGRQFPLANSYSFITNAAGMGGAPMPGFNYPDTQNNCCSIAHMTTLAKDNIDSMVQVIKDQAASENFTLQLDPPTA